MPSPKEIIRQYLDQRAKSDPQFAESYAKPKKSIDECFCYILGEARKKGTSVCMTDDEVFGLAVHYYDEDNIKVSATPPRAKVSTAKPKTAPTPSGPSEAKKDKTTRRTSPDFLELAPEPSFERRRAVPKKRTKAPSSDSNQPSLFDFLDL